MLQVSCSCPWWVTFALTCFLPMLAVTTAAAQPVPGPLLTKWADDVSPLNPHPEHPRPQMKRPNDWHCLNGRWAYQLVRPSGAAPLEDGTLPAPTTLAAGEILVPYPIESALSGCQLRLGPDDEFRYRRTFLIPDSWQDKRILLHFEAVDWSAAVTLNGTYLGSHTGGYDPFTFDITEAVNHANGSPQELQVVVTDPTDTGTQPRGKQVTAPEGIWYTPTSGIWQSVWLEAVPRAYIKSIQLTPDLDAGTLYIDASIVGDVSAATSWTLEATATTDDGQKQVGHAKAVIATANDADESAPLSIRTWISLPSQTIHPWSPDDPYLYRLRLLLSDEKHRQDADVVDSYFAMRKVSVEPDTNGITRIHLNNRPLFMFGPLDQGFWPDGLYTAPTDEALRYDIEVTKQLGYNMARKHVKIEPARWYYWCDRLGLLVWQDMPSGDASVSPGNGQIERSPDSARQYELELKRMIDARRNHPSIVMWVVFNEGWGQYDTQRLTDWARNYDPSRLVNCASGWNDVAGVGDVHDIHVYPGPGSPQPEPARAAVLGEFGGLGLPLKGHTWQDEKNWGYRSYENREQLTAEYLNLIEQLRWLIGNPGLSAAIYTQTTDVEIEVNGIMTYDRAIIKFDDLEKVTAANRSVYLPPPVLKTLVRCAHDPGEVAIAWKYTTSDPAPDSETQLPPPWTLPDYDDSTWTTGSAGFGSRGTPGAIVNTTWNTNDIWLRRTVTLPTPQDDDRSSGGGPSRDIRLLVHHDEDAQIYIDGILAAELTGYTVGYKPITMTPAAAAYLAECLKSDVRDVTLAVHCTQTTGGQYIDLGLVEVVNQP